MPPHFTATASTLTLAYCSVLCRQVDVPYVTLEEATNLQTAYIEKFWGASFHSTQLLAPWYEGHPGGVLPCA